MRQTYPAASFEVIVVNNDPNDIGPDLALPHNYQMLVEARPGSYAARNRALSHARGEIVAFTDSDCIPNPDWIERAVAQMLHGAQRIAGHVELFFASKRLTPAEIYEKAVAFNQKRTALTGGAVTANMFTWRRSFDQVGLFNESLLSGGDNEWGWRAHSQGIPVVYAPEVIVKHPARSQLNTLLAKRRRVVAGMMKIPQTSTLHGRAWVIRGFTPPVREIVDVCRRQDLSLCEKAVAGGMMYFMKIYSTTYRIKLRFGMAKPER